MQQLARAQVQTEVCTEAVKSQSSAVTSSRLVSSAEPRVSQQVQAAKSTPSESRAWDFLQNWLFHLQPQMHTSMMHTHLSQIGGTQAPPQTHARISMHGAVQTTQGHAQVQVQAVHGQPVKLLPDQQGPHRKTLVLDLDHTLIDCLMLRDPSTSEPDFVYTDVEGGQAKVWKRPGLKEFLHGAAQHFEIVLFTAAGRRHADAVLAVIDPDNQIFEHRLYGTHTVQAPEWAWVKDLSRLNRDISQVVIVDDCKYACLFHQANWISIKPFEQSDPAAQYDCALADILKFLREQVLPAQDVRHAVAKFYSRRARRLRQLQAQRAPICSAAAMAAAAAAPSEKQAPQDAATQQLDGDLYVELSECCSEATADIAAEAAAMSDSLLAAAATAACKGLHHSPTMTNLHDTTPMPPAAAAAADDAGIVDCTSALAINAKSVSAAATAAASAIVTTTVVKSAGVSAAGDGHGPGLMSRVLGRPMKGLDVVALVNVPAMAAAHCSTTPPPTASLLPSELVFDDLDEVTDTNSSTISSLDSPLSLAAECSGAAVGSLEDYAITLISTARVQRTSLQGSCAMAFYPMAVAEEGLDEGSDEGSAAATTMVGSVCA